MSFTLPDYERWKEVNPGGAFSLFDYAYAVLQDKGVSADLVLAIAGLVWPRFVQVGDLVYLAEQYSDVKAASLLEQGFRDHELEFWMNIFSVDGFLAELTSCTPEHQERFAEMLASAWRSKLSLEFPQKAFVVQIARDSEVGDLCVVFTQHPRGEDAGESDAGAVAGAAFGGR